MKLVEVSTETVTEESVLTGQGDLFEDARNKPRPPPFFGGGLFSCWMHGIPRTMVRLV